MKTKQLPKRAYSRKHFVITLIMYTAILSVCFVQVMHGGHFVWGFAALGCFIGVIRESRMRSKAKKELKAVVK